MLRNFRPSLERLPARISLSQTATFIAFHAPLSQPGAPPTLLHEPAPPVQVGPVYVQPIAPPAVA